MQFITQLVHSSSFKKKLNKFQTHKLHWKQKFDNLVLEINKTEIDCKRKTNMNKNLPKCEKRQLRNVGVQVDTKEKMVNFNCKPFKLFWVNIYLIQCK